MPGDCGDLDRTAHRRGADADELMKSIAVATKTKYPAMPGREPPMISDMAIGPKVSKCGRGHRSPRLFPLPSRLNQEHGARRQIEHPGVARRACDVSGDLYATAGSVLFNNLTKSSRCNGLASR